MHGRYTLFDQLALYICIVTKKITFPVKGITQISPANRTEPPKTPPLLKKPIDSRRVMEYQFKSYLELQGVDDKMLENSK